MAKNRRSASFLGFFTKYLISLILLISALYWLFNGNQFLQAQSAEERRLNGLLKELETKNPEAAKRIKDASKKNPYAMAVTVATLKTRKDYEIALTKFSESLKKNESNPLMDAVSLCVDKNLASDKEDREKIIQAHGSFLYLKDSEFLEKLLKEENLEKKNELKSKVEKEVFAHFEKLKEFSKDPQIWALVKYDPVAVKVFSEIEDRELRDFYVKNQEWVQDLFSQYQNVKVVSNGKNTEKSDVSEDVSIKEVLETAKKYFPLTRQTVLDSKENGCGYGPLGFQLFFKYGHLIKACVETEKVLPLCETLEVFFAQGNYLDSFMEKNMMDAAPELLARDLGKIKKEMPFLWKATKTSPGALNLYSDAPDYADGAFKQCDGIDIQILLYGDYFEEDRTLIRNATRALAKWGQMAFFTLNQYAEPASQNNSKVTEGKKTLEKNIAVINNFKKIVKNDFRSVFYVSTKGQEGIPLILENNKYLDKELKENGDPKDPSFWEHIPLVGGPLVVFNNWRQGYPNSYGELGWAVLDVVSDAMLIASLLPTGGGSGTALVAKETAKIAAKQTLKRNIFNVVKDRSKNIFAKFSGSLLGNIVLKIPSLVNSLGLGLPSLLFNIAGKTLNIGFLVAKASVKLWTSIPEALKKIVYKLFLSLSIATSIALRTVPFLWKQFLEVIKQLPKIITDVLLNAPKDLADAITKGLANIGIPSDFIRIGIRWVVFGAFMFGVVHFLPRNKLNYV